MTPTNKTGIDSPKVFISYCTPDVKYARQFNHIVKESGLETYFAVDSNTGGEEWQRRLEEEAESCDVMIVLNSPDSQKSQWMDRERQYFISAMTQKRGDGYPGKLLIPVTLYGITAEQLSPDLKIHQCVDCTGLFEDIKRFDAKIHAEVILAIKKHFSIEDKNNIKIPVITYAMTYEQVNELVSEDIFSRRDVAPAEKDRYEELKKTLSAHGLTDIKSIIDCYGDTPDDWKPLLIGKRDSVWSIVKTIEKHVNSDRISENQYTVTTLPYSFRALENPTKAPSLQHAQCILIIDAVSLFHPILRGKLDALGFTASRNTNLMMIVVPPVSHADISIYKFLEKAYTELGSMQSAFHQFAEKLEIGYELGVGDRYSLSRWLKNNLAQIAMRGRMPDESKMGKFRDAGEDFTTQIFGKGGI